jgi:hypothetical protein
MTGIPYDNAKAINRTYLREKRVQKINYRMRYHHKKNSIANSTPTDSQQKLNDINFSQENEPNPQIISQNSTQPHSPNIQISRPQLTQNYNYHQVENTMDNLKMIP